MRKLTLMAMMLVCLQQGLANGQENPPASWWSPQVTKQLETAGPNRPELQRSLQEVPEQQRRALAFLIEHMPDSDLQTLGADYLLENVRLAYQARQQAAWGSQIPEALFFNDVLPYANVDETREDWRAAMMQRCWPIVKDCRTPGEAAQKLNRELFSLIQVRYATSRAKANQSPAESMQQSVASCTGLSIILSDACRSVGIPARLVGTPSWTKKRGNHTWVEVWDNGWHFTGAAEPSPEGLDRGWFQQDAAEADDSQPRNRIYAVSYARTGMYFPMVWSPRARQVHAVNVTPRYTADRKPRDPGLTRVLVTLVDAAGNRVAHDVTVTSRGYDRPFQGRTRGEDADLNDILMFELPRQQTWQISWQQDGRQITRQQLTEDQEQTWWELQEDP